MRPMNSSLNRIIFIGFLIAAIAVAVLCPSAVMAHSPSELKLDYDLSAQTLKATITHTRFSNSHFIEKVEIRKNSNLVNLQEYKNQPAETFSYSFKVTAAAGDVLEVKAYCNVFGSRTEKLTVAQPEKPVTK